MVIVVLGPTAVGKTKMSVELAKLLNGEIINVDSTQIYKDLDIATAIRLLVLRLGSGICRRQVNLVRW